MSNHVFLTPFSTHADVTPGKWENTSFFENFFALSRRLEPWDHLQSLRKYFYRNQRPQIDLQLTGFDPKLVSSGYILHFTKKFSKPTDFWLYGVLTPPSIWGHMQNYYFLIQKSL